MLGDLGQAEIVPIECQGQPRETRSPKPIIPFGYLISPTLAPLCQLPLLDARAVGLGIRSGHSGSSTVPTDPMATVVEDDCVTAGACNGKIR
jgi:hypothetical protein